MERIKYEIGKKYGTLTIIDKKKKDGAIVYVVKCECGNIKDVYKSNFIHLKKIKCSCERKYRYGLSKSPLYQVWYEIIDRCCNKNRYFYKWYGGKGIDVCENWKGKYGYINFYNWAISNGYKEEKMKSGKNKLTIDRIDTSKGYYPENCRWVDYTTQALNKDIICTNKSGYIGVSWSKQERKWISTISLNNKTTRIGGYKTQKEAVEERNKYIDENKLPHRKNIYKGELSNGY